MEVFNNISDLQTRLATWRKQAETIALVPTMGYLHEGHQSLMAAARKENQRVVVSIFVNPLQFGPEEDLATYPRDLKRDRAICEAAGVDAIFYPEVAEMYPAGFNTFVEAFGVTEKLEGASRPTHFRGVTTVVAKLFNIVQPERAYFGQKDAQQVAVIRQMVRDLNMPVKIVPCPIIREPDGLAKSSRNTYLSPNERQQALSLSRSLQLASQLLNDERQDIASVIAALTDSFKAYPEAKVDYIKIVDPVTLVDLKQVQGEVLVLLAVYIGKTRLIDNQLIKIGAES